MNAWQLEARPLTYGFAPDDHYKYEIRYGEEGSHVQASLNVAVLQVLPTEGVSTNTLPWQTAPYYQVLCEVSSFKASFEDRRAFQSKINAAFADMPKFIFRVQINHFGHIRSTDLERALSSCRCSDDKNGIKRALVFKNALLPIVALVFSDVYPCLFREARRTATLYETAWGKLGVPEIAEVMPKSPSVLNIVHQKASSKKDAGMANIVYWHESESYKGLRELGYPRDHKEKISLRMLYDVDSGVFKTVEERREIIFSDDDGTQSMQPFFECKLVDSHKSASAGKRFLRESE